MEVVKVVVAVVSLMLSALVGIPRLLLLFLYLYLLTRTHTWPPLFLFPTNQVLAVETVHPRVVSARARHGALLRRGLLHVRVRRRRARYSLRPLWRGGA